MSSVGDGAQLTPIRRQYLEIKRRYPHAIVLFRLGDFYETFDDDAKLCAQDLEIALTSRPVGKGQRVPLAGIPYHALDGYLSKLIAKGHKVAICEQVGDPSNSRGLVEREVVRVITPGTVLESNLLSDEHNNYLVALVTADGRAGLAYIDLSTGDFAATLLSPEAAGAELARLRPSELIIPQGQPRPEGSYRITEMEPSAFAAPEASERLRAHFNASTLDAMGCKDWPLATAAAGAILRYIGENQPHAISHITRLTTYSLESYMGLDEQTVRNLELFTGLRSGTREGSLLSVLDFTRTAPGARLFRKWLGQPLLDANEIGRRQEYVNFFFESARRRSRLSELLGEVTDLERILGRVCTGIALPRDLVALRRGLEAIPHVKAFLTDEGDIGGALVAALLTCPDESALLAGAIADDPPPAFDRGGVIRKGYSGELDECRDIAGDARSYLLDLERRERERAGIRNLKVGYNKVFGYYLEVTKPNLHLVPADYQARQTLVGGARFTTPELREYEFKIVHAEERTREMETALFRQVCEQLASAKGRILSAAAILAQVDVFRSLAEAAGRYNYTRPAIDDGHEIVIDGGRHPVVERMLPPGDFVANDISLSSADAQIIILTGPNMAGKSTYLRQVALLVLMAQMGSFIPAREGRLGIVDRIFTRIGAVDDIAAGRSTFMVEMVETAAILHNATPRSLLVFDEIGRGTSTYDGLAIARAVVEYVHNLPKVAAKTLFATHYHELTALARLLPRVRNYNVAVVEDEGRVVFLHRIAPGGADRSYGVHVAELAGMPRGVVQRARDVLAELEGGALVGEDAREGRNVSRSQENFSPQLPLLGMPSPWVGELASLDVDSLSPLEAITKLYELRERAAGEMGEG